MCGICGFSGPPYEPILKRMTESIIHRGPDDDGFYSDGKVNLGMRRLSIIDLASGKQPIHNENKTIWTVFNGEIYNFLELRKDLAKRGHKFYTDHSDSEVLVHLFEDFGTKFLNSLNGMFAIAMWDKSTDSLYLMRDRMGVKPLFYSLVNGKLIFGSEIKSILAHPSYHPAMNFEGIYHYFSFKNVPAPLTAFSGIFSLKPGQLLIFKDQKIRLEQWWQINFQENENLGEEEITSHIFALLDDATQLRMRSDVPFGAYLSGGVDSSAIVSLMTRYSKQPIKTFSLGYEDELKNKEADIYYARKVSEQYNTDHHEYIMSSKELLEDIEKVLTAFDQPFSGTISTYFLSKLIKDHVVVALSGDGADELYGSYLSHRIAQPMFHFSRLRNKVFGNSLTLEERKLFYPVDLDYLQSLFSISSGDEAKWRTHLLLFKDEDKDSLLTPQFQKPLGVTPTLKLVHENFCNLSSQDPLNRILEMEWKTQLPDQVLAFVDFLSMAHSIEVRSPFLDYRLVEYSAQIPGKLKIKDGNVKDILKKTVEKLLPMGITRRPKEGFVLPIFDWMQGKLEGYCREKLSVQNLNKHGFFNTEKIGEIVEKYYSGEKPLAGKVWNLVMFQAWWERYLQ